MANKYIGNELELFESAVNWKTYYGSFIKHLNKGNVLEVGAGIGGTTEVLCDGEQERWLCVEPDPELIAIIVQKINAKILPSVCSTWCGTLEDLNDCFSTFDSILYIDVIEHIADDASELRNAYKYLKPGGKLIILVPAHNALYSPFDKQIGHHRRYNKQMLKRIIPVNMQIEKLLYLDSVGYFVSLFNKFFLKQNMPTTKQILFWDKFLIPISRILDSLFGFNIGKSLLLIIERNNEAEVL